MGPLRAANVKRAVGAASRALAAVLETRRKAILPEMLNSAGSVAAEWYVETLWTYLAKRSLLAGISGIDVEFAQPARPEDRQLHFALPHPEADDLVMDFFVMRADESKRLNRVPVASIKTHRGQRRRWHGVAPDPPLHPYGIEVRRRNLNPSGQVSWYTLVSVTMDVARRGVQIADPRDYDDPHLIYVVPRFSFTPLADAVLVNNLFIYPDFALEQAWAPGKTSAKARVMFWAVANDFPYPLADCSVSVVRTSLVDGVRRPVDETGRPGGRGRASVSV